MSKSSEIITGEALFRALSTLKRMVKWVRNGSRTVKIEASAALVIVKAGCYEGRMEGGRLRLIREVDNRKPNVAVEGFWDDRSVLHYAGGVGCESVDAWVRSLRGAA